MVLSPDKKAIPYGALEIYLIKHIFKQQGINISNGAAEAIAEKAKLDFTPKWDAGQQKYVHNDKDGLYYRMTLDKALAELPADIREKLKQIDAKTLLSAMMVGGVAIAALKKLPSRAVAVLAAGLTLKDIIQYGAEANHIADKIKDSTKPGDLPVEELKALITNGGLDILLAGVGYAGVKLAPKFASSATTR